MPKEELERYQAGIKADMEDHGVPVEPDPFAASSTSMATGNVQGEVATQENKKGKKTSKKNKCLPKRK